MRLVTLDILKGIGIILVVIGHMIGNQLNIRPWIYAFHMPMFFMIAGYCFDKHKYPDIGKFAWQRMRTLLIPCLYFIIISILLMPEYIVEKQYEKLKTDLPGALWFLPMLFLVEIVAYRLTEINNVWKILILSICALFSLYIRSLELPTIHRDTQFPMSLFFYLLGNYMRSFYKVRSFLTERLFSKILYLIIGILGCTLTYLYVYIDALQHNQCVLNYFNIGMLLACLSSIAGLICISILLIQTQANSAITYIGRNTLIIMCVHCILISMVDYYLRPIVPIFAIYKPLSILLVGIGCLAMIKLVNNYVPFLIGRSFNKK